ncbi:hypothetical protein I5Q34_26805 [Streptomyces sp. AV19]|uniref:hypothetical protein n=1 Tax=Streptomyces sp. AV19 TaxID=2793068 RepID=UPI0018FE2E0B|nr:hypothetical protein [Streptomyces sp. AV19]MBH1937837.1 hypothetical protein [Streptomyces sp. AV19]MDG4537115.1 hypothetical protein [Streptomyces sp. AV19]
MADGTERALNEQHQHLRETLNARYTRVSRLDQDDAAFDAEYRWLVNEAEQLIAFETQLPARLAEPRRAGSERVVRWSWRAEAAVAAGLISTVFLTDSSTWWLVLLIPHLLATLAGWSVKVTTARHVRQRRTAIGLHVLCLVVALVSLSVLSAWFIAAIVFGWLLIAGISDGTEPEEQRR